jgi:hypothetical protein
MQPPTKSPRCAPSRTGSSFIIDARARRVTAPSKKMTATGHFQTKPEAASLRLCWSHSPTGADVLAPSATVGAGGSCTFYAPPPSFILAVALLQDAAAVLLLLAAARTRHVAN